MPSIKSTALKVCSKCKDPKPIGHFAFRCEERGTRRSECKDCHNSNKRSYYSNNEIVKVAASLRRKESKNKLKAWIKELKEKSGCKSCPESSPTCLDFHHRNPKTKVSSISDMIRMTKSREEIIKEIRKCDCLCANCHRKVHSKLHNK
jgi:hypothetical protein